MNSNNRVKTIGLRIAGSSMRQQRGVALVVSLLLLLAMIVVGAATMSGSHMQERMSGNANLQSQAFEAASAGVADAINFYVANKEDSTDQCGGLNHLGWDSPTDWVVSGTVGNARLSQRMYCLADEYPDEEGGRPPKSQLFVLSRGEILADGVPVAVRDIEVRLGVGAPGVAGDGCGAICFPACQTNLLNFPTSNAFQVNGDGGPAITAGCQTVANSITSAIRSNRIGNYIGGIVSSIPGSPWDSPSTLDTFRMHILAAAVAKQMTGTCMTGCYFGGAVNNMGNSQYGTPGNPQITYINGNASMGGGISGAGIMVVKGNLTWNGTPAFKGLLVVLGGTLTVAGGGIGGDHGGSVVIINANGTSPFGAASFVFDGGGDALYQFNCDYLWAAHDLLSTSAKELWNPECESGPATPYDANAEDLVIASWRENVGWREDWLNGVEEEE